MSNIATGKAGPPRARPIGRGQMHSESFIQRIADIRAELIAVMKDCEYPQIETMLRNADMELHWALWNLGVAVPIRPEAEYEAGADR